jgi:DNA-binding response OmpR family regulator
MPRKVLIVDDEQDIVLMLKKQFETSGFAVETAGDGQEGLAKAKKGAPDIVILDEMMPRMDGYTVAGLLKSDARFKKIPIIMFSARAEESDANLSHEVGIDLYLTKLVDFTELLKKVNGLLEAKSR